MSASISPPRPRRRELAEAFEHLGRVAASADLTGIDDPDQRNLHVARYYGIRQYGAVGPAVDLNGVTFEEVSAGGVPAVWVTAENASTSRRIVYLHGGGWRSGAPDDYRALGAVLARLSAASILMADYRLAPEHRFPAGLDDCVTAYLWAVGNGPAGSADLAEVIALAGDSAGGNLAAAACLRLHASGERVPDRLALIAGTLDNVETERRVGLDDPICPPAELAICTQMYLPDGHSAADPYVSPVCATNEELAGFPPTLLQVSSIEALAWDSKRFASRLEQAGVRVDLSVWPELPHVWHQFLGLFPEAYEALDQIAAFIGRPGSEVRA